MDIKEMSEKDKSLAEIRRGTTTDFGVTLSRPAISRHLRTKLKKKSVKKRLRAASTFETWEGSSAGEMSPRY